MSVYHLVWYRDTSVVPLEGPLTLSRCISPPTQAPFAEFVALRVATAGAGTATPAVTGLPPGRRSGQVRSGQSRATPPDDAIERATSIPGVPASARPPTACSRPPPRSVRRRARRDPRRTRAAAACAAGRPPRRRLLGAPATLPGTSARATATKTSSTPLPHSGQVNAVASRRGDAGPARPRGARAHGLAGR